MKANKQGISLIVLVITIVVVIILAAAVILSLNGNNPIDNARIANFAQTKDGLYSAIYSYTGTVQGKTQGYFSNDQILLGSVAGEDSSTEPIIKNGSTGFSIVKMSTTDPKGATAITVETIGGTEKTVYELDATNFEKNIEEDLPATPISGSSWVIDQDGQVYLYFSDIAKMPAWMGYDKKATEADAKLKNAKEDSTISSTVVKAKSGT